MTLRSAVRMSGLLALGLAGAIGASHRGATSAHHIANVSGGHQLPVPPSGHDAAEGLVLGPFAAESVVSGARCPSGAPVRQYDIVALAVNITLNRYGDHDPQGRMYALAGHVQEVRAAARRGADGVSLGLQGDVIQPLVLRVLQGECLRVHLTNQLADEPASFHLHASSLVVASDASPAVAANPAALAAPGASVTYEWMVPASEPEGTHVFHSHGNERVQSEHGLFGAVIVEPAGSAWADPRTGTTDTVGWDAVVRPPGAAAFREFVLFYHEIGDEDFRVKDVNGHDLPQVDPTTSAYRPGSRALNYRSEPFYNRLSLAQQQTGRVDESLAYSSYAFGDPATPIERSYIGDPVKERILNAGGEVFHVHHVHGGSVRWRRQPGAGPTGFGAGLDKHPPLLPGPSERTDSQTIGPSETFDVEHECSAGGCQQGAGDYLIHCHIAHHYFAGMWGIWRVYDTLQDGRVSTDALPPLPELSDRVGSTVAAVTSDALSPAGYARAVASLPPAGVRKGYDASVFDWTEQAGRIVGEPETDAVWPGYKPVTPGQRPAMLFEPATGRPAYPMLRPHLAARPPFAPGNGPAAYLDRPRPDGVPPPPGADGPQSLCPAGTSVRRFSMRATELAVPINDRLHLVDPQGAEFVLAENEAAVQSDPSLRGPLAIRANAGEHCVDVTLTNAIPDNLNHPFSKISAHIHFVQFDVQASDGVDAGFNFEQTVRPFAIEGERTTVAVEGGALRILVGDTGRFSVGAFVGVGLEESGSFEVRRITAIEGADTVVFDRALDRAHPVGAIVSAEFLRYRWYADAQVGTAYFHDHVNGIRSWQHGLVGALVVEPPGATYHDPTSGKEVSSGALVDIHAPARTPVSADVSGSFREFISFIQDPSKLTNVDRSPGTNLNLRAEPLDRREGPVEQLFSSTVHGDPATPLVRAYVGDPLVIRTTVGGTNEIHTWHIDGHWFRDEAWSLQSRPVSTTHLGISERKDLSIAAAGGPQQRPGDYLYYDGRALKLREGAWGLLRVISGPVGGDLEPLPGHDPPRGQPPPVCPVDAPQRRYAVAAIEANLPMLGPAPGRIFVEASSVASVRAGTTTPTPLVLRAAIGDCLEVTLDNQLPAGSPPVALHADNLAFDPATSGGIEAGRNPAQSVAVGGVPRTYTFFADPQYGEGAAMLRDGGDIAHSPAQGLYGAVVIAPKGATFDDATAWSTVVHAPDGRSWRDAVLFMHDSDDAIGTHRMPYTTTVRGAVGLNYGIGPSGPVIDAYAGDPIVFHVLAPWSEQVQVFSLEGHRWPIEPAMTGTTHVGSIAIGGMESINVIPDGGAGGDNALAGTYEFGDHREPYREAGMTGKLVVHDRLPPLPGLAPLPGPAVPASSSPTSTSTTSTSTTSTSTTATSVNGRTRSRSSSPVLAVVLVAVGVGAAAIAVGELARRRRARRRGAHRNGNE